MPISPLTPEQIPADLVNQLPPGAQVVKLSPEEEMQFANPGAKVVGPRDLSEDDLFSLADTQQFNPRTFAASNPEVLQDSDLVKKLSRVNARLQDRGFKLKNIAVTPEDPNPGTLSGAWNVVKKAGEGAAHFAKGVALNAANLLTIFPAAGAAITPGGVTPQQAGEILQKTFAETGAALESGATSIIEGAQTAAKKAGQLLGGTPYLDRPENEQISDFLNSVDREKLREERITAHGPFMKAVGGEIVSGLEEKGIGPEPERIAEMAGSDPLSLLMFGKIFGGVHKVGKLVEPIVAPIQKTAAEALKQSLSESLTAAGSAGKAVSKTVEVAAKPLPTLGTIAGAAKGAVIGGPGGAVIGAGAGASGGRVLAKGLRGVSKAASGQAGIATEVGEQVLSPLTSAAQGYRAVIDAFPKFLTDTAAGAGLDIGLIAVSTELPDEAGAMPLLGTAFGAGKGVLSGARQFAVSTKFAPDFWQNPGEWAKPYTPNNSFSQLAELHKTTTESAPEIQTARVNAVNSFLSQQKSDALVYFVNDEAGLSQALEQIYSRQGVPDAAERAKFASSQNGMFTENIVDDAGKPRRVIIAKNPDSAPHEGFHGVQAVLGESANQAVDLMVYKAYADRWDLEGREHISRLLGQIIPKGVDWREPLRQATGVESADVYLARELAAENFDYLFRAGLDRPKGLPGKLADIVLNLTDLFGTSPLAGERSPVLGIEPKLEIVEGIRRQVSPTSIEAKKVPSGRTTVIPTTPKAQQDAAQQARVIAADAPDTIQAGGTSSPRELLGQLAEAIAQRSGVKLNYLSAPGEPAAAITSNRAARRDIIEAFRTMPAEARALWEKNFFPERVIQIKGGKYQILGWSPEVFAANAHKLAGWLAGHPKVATPYAVDAATKSFTPDAWQQLFSDTQQFVQNQQSGATGAGGELVVPRSVTERGFTAPARTGGETALAQANADIINMLFGFKLPETPRVTKGRLPLSIAGEEVSAATMPGRVIEPAKPRAPFSGAEAEALGIAGRTIQEVNPFRQQVEQVGNAPSMIESVQRLNLENIREVAAAPEIPEFRGNTLTLTAGFQPKSYEAVVDRMDDLPSSLLKDYSRVAKIMSPGMTPEQVKALPSGDYKIAIDILDSVSDDLGRYVDHEGIQPDKTSKIVSREGNVIQVKFQPVAEQAKRLVDMTPDEWKSTISDYKGKLGGGLTGWAFDLGASAKNVADVTALREAVIQLNEAAKSISIADEGGFDRKMDLIGRGQAAREAFEAATGSNLEGSNEGSALPFIRKHIDANYKPPVPGEVKPVLKMAAQPRRSLPNSARDEDFKVVHYSSNEGLKQTNPKFFGKGKATPTDLRGAPKTYFFVEGSDFGQDSALFENAGLSAYETTIPGSRLYDIREGRPDDLNWRSTVNREEADDNIRAAGYDGIVLDTEDGRQVVAMFKPVKVTPKTQFQPARESEETGTFLSGYAKPDEIKRRPQRET